MAVTNISTVSNQIEKFWSPLFAKELRKNSLIANLVNKDYQGEIKQGGDTVRVSQINAPTGQNLTIGTNADTFASEQLSLSYIDIQATKRAVASFEFDDLSQLQSQIDAETAGGPASEIRLAMAYAVDQQINAYLMSLVSPSTASPDHLVNSVTDCNKAHLGNMRLLAATAKWEKSKGWWGLLDPSYYQDVINDTTLSSRDFAEGDKPMVGGQVVQPRMGFNLLEDNSIAVDQGLFFHPDFLHLVIQRQIQFKISDLHPLKKFGYLISADVIYGAKLGIAGNVKHILSCASASAGSVVMGA
jgi:hypothetical protein